MYNLKIGGVYIEITSFCNRECPYCYNDSTSQGIQLDTKTLYAIFDECRSCGINSISLSGGEPFSHKNIKEIISKIEELKMTSTIITNLSFLTPSDAADLARRGHRFQVTLDYPEAIINDETRGHNSYNLVIELLQSFKVKDLSDNIILRYNVNKRNVSKIEDIIKIAIENNIRTLDFALLFKSGRGCSYNYVFDYYNDIDQIRWLMNYFEELVGKYAGKLNISYTKLNKQLGCMLYSDGDLLIGPKIEPNGDVYVCQLFSGKENSLGNIKEASLREILSSERAHNVVDRIRMRKKQQINCKKCGFTDLCMCGCPAVSYNQTGDLFEKSDQCSMIKYFLKEQIKQLGVQL